MHPCPMTRVVRRPGTFLLLKEIGINCCVGYIRCLKTDNWPWHRKRVGLGSMLCRFRRLRHYRTLRALCPCHTVTLFNTLSATSTGKLTVARQTGRKSEAHIDILPCNSFQHSAHHTHQGIDPFSGGDFYLLTDLDEICTAYVNLNSNSILFLIFFLFRYGYR